MKVSVVIGRFQIDTLHKAHIELLSYAFSKGNIFVVLLGVPAFVGTKRDPLSFNQRREMILSEYPSAIVMPIMDMENNKDWSTQVDTLLSKTFPKSSITLYCAPNGFKSSYTGKYQVDIIPIIAGISATDRRKEIANVEHTSEDFRRGIIHSIMNSFFTEAVIPCVDIAVFNGKFLLVGRKEDEQHWRLPGGKVDPTDLNLKSAALRELFEETQLTLEGGCEYVTDGKVKDWRAREDNHISVISTLFMGQYTHGLEKGSDDLPHLKWIDTEKVSIYGEIFEGHRDFIGTAIKKQLTYLKGLKKK